MRFLGTSWATRPRGLLSELVTQAAGPPGNVKFRVSDDETTCMAACFGLTDQVVQATMPYHAKLVHKSAKEMLAVELLNRQDLRAWLRATQDVKEENKKRKRDGKMRMYPQVNAVIATDGFAVCWVGGHFC
jgi:hypothetical protein